MKDTSVKVITEPVKNLVLQEKLVARLRKNQTEPSVEGVEYWIAQNSVAVTINRFKNGMNAHTLFILGDGNTTIAHNGYVKTNTGANKLLETEQVYVFLQFENVWYELAFGGSSIAVGSSTVYYGNGSPEGVVSASIGDIYEQRDAASGAHPIWIKRTGTSTNTGWVALSGFAGAGTNSIAIGTNSSAPANNGVAIGNSADTEAGQYNIAIGYLANGGTGVQNVGIGYSVTAGNSFCIGIGNDVDISSVVDNGIAIGSSASVVVNDYGIAIGTAATCGGLNSIALGRNAYVDSTEAGFCVIGDSGAAGITTLRVGDSQVLNPADITFRIHDALTVDNPGADWYFITSRNTGAGAAGRFLFQTGEVGASGSALSAATTRLEINEDGIDVTGSISVNGAPLSLGEANTSSNSGAGGAGTAALALAKSGVDLPFRRLKQGSGVTLTENADDVEIAFSGAAGEANTSSNSGAGVGLAKAKVGVDLPFKSLVAGANITLTPTADEITIASSGGSSGSFPEQLFYAGIF
jgi:hypothetical protein